MENTLEFIEGKNTHIYTFIWTKKNIEPFEELGLPICVWLSGRKKNIIKQLSSERKKLNTNTLFWSFFVPFHKKNTPNVFAYTYLGTPKHG